LTKTKELLLVSSKDESIVHPAAGSHFEIPAALAIIAEHEASKTITAAVTQGPRSNVISGANHYRALAAGLTAVADVVARTLGPHGATAIIRDQSGAHFATKDGYTVLKHLTFVQETAQTTLDLARSIARSVVRTVGDGSSTVVVMADTLLNRFQEAELTERYPPGAVMAAISATADTLAVQIRKASRPVSTLDYNFGYVAAIAANNDPQVGSLITGVYEKYGAEANIFVGTSSTSETEVHPEPGYRVLRGMASDAFANTASAEGAIPTTCELLKPAVMLYGGRVEMADFIRVIAPVMNGLLSKGKTFVLLAQGYGPDVLRALTEFRLKSPSIGLLLIDHAMQARRSQARLGDLAAVLSAVLVDPEIAVSLKMPLVVPGMGQEGPEHNDATYASLVLGLGGCQRVRSTASETVFVGGAGTGGDAVRLRAKDLEEQADRISAADETEAMSEECEDLWARIRSLRGTEVTVLAGGDTEQEKRALAYLLDDAALACKAALRSGVVEGLGLTALRALRGPLYKDLVLTVTEAVCARTRIPPWEAESLACAVLSATADAYMDAFLCVLENGRISTPKVVMEQCLTNGTGYDALSRTHTPSDSPTVINPADTDVAVLRGAMSIVGMLVTSNQTLLLHFAAGGDLD
jgi:chaperonin GroEL